MRVNMAWSCQVGRPQQERVLIVRRSGYRAFAVSGPHVWNSLPTEIRQSCNNLLQFKSKLKTFLFQQS